MTPATRKTQTLLIIGVIAMLAALIGDSYLHLSFAVLAALVAVAVVCFLLSNRAARRVQFTSPPVPLRRRHQRFAIFFGAALIGCILGSFVLPVKNAHFSLTTRMLIALASLLTATAILAWKIYFPRHKPPKEA
jgi:hypothetical protein